MVIISVFGGLVLVGAVFAILKRCGEGPDKHDKELHIA